jgi:hypothetical protein
MSDPLSELAKLRSPAGGSSTVKAPSPPSTPLRSDSGNHPKIFIYIALAAGLLVFVIAIVVVVAYWKNSDGQNRGIPFRFDTAGFGKSQAALILISTSEKPFSILSINVNGELPQLLNNNNGRPLPWKLTIGDSVAISIDTSSMVPPMPDDGSVMRLQEQSDKLYRSVMDPLEKKHEDDRPPKNWNQNLPWKWQPSGDAEAQAALAKIQPRLDAIKQQVMNAEDAKEKWYVAHPPYGKAIVFVEFDTDIGKFRVDSATGNITALP